MFGFQRVLRSAGGLEVQVQVRSRHTGAGLCPAAGSVPVVCRTTVWIQITTATVMQTTTNGNVSFSSNPYIMTVVAKKFGSFTGLLINPVSPKSLQSLYQLSKFRKTNIFTTIKWIAITFGTAIHVPLRMKCNDLVIMTFHVAPSSGRNMLN